MKTSYFQRMLICILVGLCSHSLLLAQQRVLTGTVTDQKSAEGLSGVSISAPKTIGTLTDTKGNYSIKLDGSVDSLTFSYVGYQSKIILLDSITTDTLNVTLLPENESLEQVVVVGYGTQKRKEITSAIASLSPEDFNKGGVNNPMDLIQGKVAGLSITNTKGNNPNAGPSIQLRGVTSLTGTNTPLIVIDGIPGGSLDLVQQDDIESIDVLKDGSAAAIYGTRANGGVILITTKKGKKGETQYSFNTYAQRDFVDKRPDNLSAAEFRNLIKEGVIDESQDFGATTDLFDELVNKNNLSTYYNLAAAGGSDNANYRASVFYHDAQSIAKEDGRKEFGGRISLNQTGLKGRLTLQTNLAVNLNKANLLGGGTLEDGGDNSIGNFEQAVQWNPTAPLIQPDGTYTQLQAFNNYNPLSRLAYRIYERDQSTISADSKLSLEITKDLKASVFGSYTRNQYNDRRFRSSKDWDQRPETSYGGMSWAQKANYLDWTKTLEATVNYDKSFGKSEIHALGGYSYQYGTSENYSVSNDGFPTDTYLDWNLGAGTGINNLNLPRPGISSYKEDNTLIAFFGRVSYSFDNRIFLQAILRHEGSSRFGINNKWGNFPAISAGWTLTNEAFMKNISWLNYLKVRAGYGVTGNQGIPNYQSLYLLSTGGVYPQVTPGTGYDPNSPNTTQFFQTYGIRWNVNPNLRWEKKGEFNAGIDFGVVNNRISGSLDFYSRKTKDLLYAYTVPQPSFVQSTLLTNIGSVSSKGVELTLNGKAVDNKDFKWDVTLTGSYNSNKLTKLSSENFKVNYLEFGGLPSPGNLGNTIRLYEGSAIGNFYGYRFAGFTDEGKWQFYKADGTLGLAGDMSPDDRTVIGNGVPKINASLGNRFYYKGFDLTIFFRGKFKYDILNTPALFFGNKRWLPNNLLQSAVTKYKQLDDDPQYSDFYLENGNFVKLDNITLGYTFNFKTDYIKSCYLYVTGRNIATFTGYSGLDPELEDTGFTTGIDNRGFFPRTKSWMIGLNLNF